MLFSQPSTRSSGVGDARNGRGYTPQVRPQWPVALLWLAQGRRHCVLGPSKDEAGERPCITEQHVRLKQISRVCRIWSLHILQSVEMNASSDPTH